VKVLILTGIANANLDTECQTYAVNTFMPEKWVAGIWGHNWSLWVLHCLLQ